MLLQLERIQLPKTLLDIRWSDLNLPEAVWPVVLSINSRVESVRSSRALRNPSNVKSPTRVLVIVCAFTCCERLSEDTLHEKILRLQRYFG